MLNFQMLLLRYYVICISDVIAAYVRIMTFEKVKEQNQMLEKVNVNLIHPTEIVKENQNLPLEKVKEHNQVSEKVTVNVNHATEIEKVDQNWSTEDVKHHQNYENPNDNLYHGSEIFLEETEIDLVQWNREFETRAKFWKERDKLHEQEKKALSAELEAERQSRQKLLSSQYELQERLDSMQRAPSSKEHKRSLSDASTNSQQETTVEDIYHTELESQPEFFKFKDWCKSLKLYSGQKSGIPERDVKLHCGFMKAGIAIYKWPPPIDTVAVNSRGVELVQGFFDDHPVNEPTKFLVRVYIVRGINLIARSFTGHSDPYVVINCGSKHSEDNNRYMTNALNPVFGKMYEFQCCLPEDYLLTVSLYDREALSPDDLIGTTAIDLEDRIYSKHRARVGLASEYKIMGPAKWRDCLKPSAILEEVCLKNHIPGPIFLDNTVIVNEIQYKDTDQTKQTYISESERKQNICLELLHKWQTLPLCGYQLVPEHVETRKLFNPDQPVNDQGKIQMWVDIFPLDTGKYIPLPVDIAPRKVEDYELRLTVWSVQGIRAIILGENKRKDIYIKAWIGGADQAQYTDIHYQSLYGEGVFNWRMIFHFQYQHAEKRIILNEKGPFTEVEEHLPPVLIIQLIDCDAVSNNECLGTLTLDLNSIPRGSKHGMECKLCTLDNIKRVNLFSMRSIRGWWPLKSIDLNTGSTKFAGVIDLEMSLMQKEMALIMPVGLGRDPPFPLPEPNRPDPFQGMAKPSFLEAIFNCGGTEFFVVGVILIVTFATAFYWKFPFMFLSTLLG